MKRNAYLLLIMTLAFLACKDNRVEKVNLKNAVDSKIAALKKNSKSDRLKLDLCVLIPLKWDSLVVVTGYATPQTLSGFKFENQHALGQFIDMVPESSYMLLYIKSNNIVGYSDLPLPVLDFSRISNHAHLGFTIMYEKDCRNLIIRKYITNGRVNFKFDNKL